MSTGFEATPPEPDGLQFDHAEFEQAPPSEVTCAACKRPIEQEYFEINGTIVCEPCKDSIATHLRGGSGFVRLLRALTFGTAAGVVGTLLYLAFIQVFQFDLALVSIFVGYLIGRAVRAGSRNRGGLFYQVLAVLLTYLSVGATHAARVFLAHNPGVDPDLPNSFIVRAILFIVLSVVMPVENAKESVITIAIVGFALWQAWKVNVKLKLALTGPYRVGDSGPEGAIEGEPAHA